jgi:hypothetical protein
MPDMSTNAAEIDSAGEVLERIIYRNARMLDRLGDKEDPVPFVQLLAAGNRSDLLRLSELIDYDVSHLIAS